MRNKKKDAREWAFGSTVDWSLQEVASINNTTVTEVNKEIEKFIDVWWEQDKMGGTGLFKVKPSIEEFLYKVSCLFN